MSVGDTAQFWPDSRRITVAPGTPITGAASPVPNAPVINLTPEQLALYVTKKNPEAIKFDDGKIDWSLVPMESLEGMVKVLMFGAKKYSEWNWAEGGGFKWSRVLSSTFRHLFAFMRGEDNDPESGLSHIYHAQCNMLFMAHYIGNKNKFNKDDRVAR